MGLVEQVSKFVDAMKNVFFPTLTIYCVQPFTVKQRCILNECIAMNDNRQMVDIGFLYKSQQKGKRAYHWRDREREY